MITGNISQLHLYKGIHPNLGKAIDYLLQADLFNIPIGKYEIAGEEIFYMVNEYSTKPAIDCEPERHRVYTDIQIMVSGTEKFGYTPFYKQIPSTDFLPDNDVAFYTIAPEAINYITLTTGEFIIFSITDIHQPEVFVNAPMDVRKLVVKVQAG